MKPRHVLLAFALLLTPYEGRADALPIWDVVTGEGMVLTQVSEMPSVGDEYISAENGLYEIVEVNQNIAVAEKRGEVELPPLDWLDADAAVPVTAIGKRIALYCTHSDESYAPSDGIYSTNDRGSIYQVAQALADNLRNKGIEAVVADTLHHPHDAGAYRRSRQTAVQLLKEGLPDCLIDVHRDGIPDPASYAVRIGGEDVSKIRLLVGRGNQNAAVNKEFALLIKAVADRIYPGLIKDIYLGKGTFNQDLLPKSILFECGTYTLEKERVLRSMPLMADVLNRALYGGVVGSAGRVVSDVNMSAPKATAGVTMGQPDVPVQEQKAIGSGFVFLGILLLLSVVGIAILSTGSLRGGMKKSGRNLREMSGGLIGRKPRPDEEHEHS